MHIADVHYRCALRFKSLVDGVRSPPLRSIMIIPKTKTKNQKNKNPLLKNTIKTFVCHHPN